MILLYKIKNIWYRQLILGGILLKCLPNRTIGIHSSIVQVLQRLKVISYLLLHYTNEEQKSRNRYIDGRYFK